MLFTSIKPMLLTTEKDSFDDDNYLFEPKWDGWRIIIHKNGDKIEAYTKNGKHISKQFPELRQAAQAIKSHSAILDCEGICLRDGKPNFDDFSYRGRIQDPMKIKTAAVTNPATFVAFDIIQTDKDHTNESLMERKKRLNEAIETSEVLIPTLSVEGEGKSLHQMTIEQEMEGIVAKRKQSKYLLDTRSADWMKIKNYRVIDMVILGYRTAPHFALITGVHFPTVKNKPIAVVEWGFKPEEKAAFLEIAKQIKTVSDKKTQWIEPRLCCKVQYQDRTDTHHLRNVSFKGFLFEKKPEDCVWHS